MRTKKGKILTGILSFLIVVAILISAPSVYAWLTYSKKTVFLKGGELSFDVSGKYAMYKISNNETTMDGTPKVLEKKSDRITLEAIGQNSYTVFAFTIKNTSNSDGKILARFSDFTKYIFNGFDIDADSHPLNMENISKYNAKFSLVLSDLYYIVGEPEEFEPDETAQKTILYQREGSENYLWEYGAGQFFIEKSKDETGNEQDVIIHKDETLTFYISFYSRQLSDSMQKYSEWLDEYGFEYIKARCVDKRKTPTSNGEITAEEEQEIKDYLTAYYKEEVKSVSASSGLENLSLSFDYIEFILESLPKY